MKNVSFITQSTDILLLVTGISVGFMFVSGAINKIRSPEWFASTFAKAGIPFPELLSALAAWVELLAGLSLILGLVGRISSIILAIVMVALQQ